MNHDLRIAGEPDVSPDAVHQLSWGAACALASVELGDTHVELLAKGCHLVGTILQELKGIADDLDDAAILARVDLHLCKGSEILGEFESLFRRHASASVNPLLL